MSHNAHSLLMIVMASLVLSHPVNASAPKIDPKKSVSKDLSFERQETCRRTKEKSRKKAQLQHDIRTDLQEFYDKDTALKHQSKSMGTSFRSLDEPLLCEGPHAIRSRSEARLGAETSNVHDRKISCSPSLYSISGSIDDTPYLHRPFIATPKAEEKIEPRPLAIPMAPFRVGSPVESYWQDKAKRHPDKYMIRGNTPIRLSTHDDSSDSENELNS